MIISLCALIAVLTWIVFGQTLRHEFVNFDDDAYVCENPAVRQGLTVAGAAWAFGHVVASNWHPLTILSHMADCQFYGLQAGGHHFTSLLLQMLTAILLFLVLRGMTNVVWPSFFVAAVFAVHPLRAESVAWVSERKDVLSGFFFMLTLAAYVRYARGPRSAARYLAVLILFALGLMSKPMLVTLPAVLLLLDYWPLGRITGSGALTGESKKENANPSNKISRASALWEKVPLFLMSAAICVTTLLTQDAVRRASEAIPLSMRLGNAIVSGAVYVRQLFYPVNLAAFYPFPAKGMQFLAVAGSALFLAGITWACLHWRRKCPWLLTGWLWYLVMLSPVIGLVQVGAQAHADRYTYLPEIGLCLGLTWAIVELTAKWENRRMLLGVGGGIILAALVVTARAQTAYWRDSETLWNHALACTTGNAVAESNLANDLLRQNRLDDAITHARAAVEIKPDYVDALNCLGYALFEGGRVDEAISRLQEALKSMPDFAAAHNNLGLALRQKGRLDEAIVEFRAALKTHPEAADSHSNLGIVLLQTGQPEAAVAEYNKAVELSPDFIGANNNLAWLLATCPKAGVRNGLRAIQLAEHANQLSNSGNLVILRTLAAAYAEGGRFPEAIQTAGRALKLATTEGKSAWVAALRSDLGLYQSGQPLRDAGKQ